MVKARKHSDIKMARAPKTIFYTLLENSLPESEKTVDHLGDEGFVLVLAGAETTRKILQTILYQLLANPELLIRVQQGLHQAMPDSDGHTQWHSSRVERPQGDVHERGKRSFFVPRKLYAQVMSSEDIAAALGIPSNAPLVAPLMRTTIDVTSEERRLAAIRPNTSPLVLEVPPAAAQTPIITKLVTKQIAREEKKNEKKALKERRKIFKDDEDDEGLLDTRRSG